MTLPKNAFRAFLPDHKPTNALSLGDYLASTSGPRGALDAAGALGQSTPDLGRLLNAFENVQPSWASLPDSSRRVANALTAAFLEPQTIAREIPSYVWKSGARRMSVSVFISHRWDYDDDFQTIFSWVFNRLWQFEGRCIDFYNTSVPKDSPIHGLSSDKAIAAALWERIAQSDVVVTPCTVAASNSYWVCEEQKYANLLGRPNLAVRGHRAKRESTVVRGYATGPSVGWKKRSVVDGIVLRILGRVS